MSHYRMRVLVALMLVRISVTSGCQRQSDNNTRKLEERLNCVESALNDVIAANLMCVVNEIQSVEESDVSSQSVHVSQLLRMVADLADRVAQLERSSHLPPYQARDCSEVYQHGGMVSGRYLTVLGDHMGSSTLLCEMDSSIQWTVLQQRMTGKTLFNRTWEEYKAGFGEVSNSTDFWIGLKAMHAITSRGQYTLRVELMDSDNETRYAEYSEFSVASEEDGYRLTIGGYRGNAGDSLGPHNGSVFTTIDMDQDPMEGFNCARHYGGGGGWWFGAGGCRKSNLNGEYRYPPFDQDEKSNRGIVWAGWENHVFRSFLNVSMKIHAPNI